MYMGMEKWGVSEMTFVRESFDTDKPEVVSEKYLRRILQGNYKDIDLAIHTMKESGEVIRTSFATYRYVADKIK